MESSNLGVKSHGEKIGLDIIHNLFALIVIEKKESHISNHKWRRR